MREENLRLCKDSIDIPIDKVQYGNLKSFYIHNWDSIFIYVRGPRSIHPTRDKELFLINSLGELVRPLPYADQLNLFDPDLEDQDPNAESIMSNQWDPIHYTGSQLVFGLIPYNLKENLTKKYLSAGLDLTSGKINYPNTQLLKTLKILFVVL